MLRFLRSGSRHTKMIWWIITIATAGSFALMFNAFGTGFDSRNTARPLGACAGSRARLRRGAVQGAARGGWMTDHAQ